MADGPRIELEPLRQIGWAKWDPIGVGGQDSWAVEEYDTYLLKAAGDLWKGRPETEVADYLVKVETQHMGLEAVPGVRERARNVVQAMAEYVATRRS